MAPNKAVAAIVCILLSVPLIANAQSGRDSQSVFKRASWLESVQTKLFAEVQRAFKTRYDGSVWARACRKPAMAERLGLNRQELRSFVFERLGERSDIGKITPLEKWVVVNGVVGMTDTYLSGGKAFVRAGREDCAIAIRGLNREFPQ